jgi:Domain of unknown function (DUF4396)
MAGGGDGAHTSAALDRLALQATLHCLSGCTIGEVLGMVVGTALGWKNAPVVALSIVLAFFSGYILTMRPLLGAGIALPQAIRLALAADTVSIAVMEVVDNAFMLVVPGAMNAPLSGALFWGSLLASLALAGFAAFPINRWLVVRGRGPAAVHGQHGHAGGAHHH